jgi:hypothetical protein
MSQIAEGSDRKHWGNLLNNLKCCSLLEVGNFMKLHRSIAEPIRTEARWDGPDQGLIACWERGRTKSREDIPLASRAKKGELVVLPWKGRVEKASRAKKYGPLYYLAMWQGLRGEDLNIDTELETELVCTATGGKVIFTNDIKKYGGP